MKVWLLIGFIALVNSAAPQSKNSCVGSDLKFVNALIHLKGFPYKDSLHVPSNSFNKEIELVSADPNIHIKGFTILFSCHGCDIYEFSTCGNKIQGEFLKKLENLFASGKRWFGFYNITIGLKGRKYFAPEFSIFPLD